MVLDKSEEFSYLNSKGDSINDINFSSMIRRLRRELICQRDCNLRQVLESLEMTAEATKNLQIFMYYVKKIQSRILNLPNNNLLLALEYLLSLFCHFSLLGPFK